MDSSHGFHDMPLRDFDPEDEYRTVVGRLLTSYFAGELPHMAPPGKRPSARLSVKICSDEEMERRLSAQRLRVAYVFK